MLVDRTGGDLRRERRARTERRTMDICVLLLAALPGFVCSFAKPASAGEGKKEKANHSVRKEVPGAKDQSKTAYDFELPAPNGRSLRLSDYRGKTLLIVNLASKSSYASQLPELEKLSQAYQAHGLVVIGVPSNDFGGAEPDTEDSVEKLYRVKDKITFLLAAKSALTGVQELPLYRWLTESEAAPPGGPVHWNYTKFFVDKNGHVLARFSQDIAPDSPELTSALEEILSGTYKPATKVAPPKDDSEKDDAPRS